MLCRALLAAAVFTYVLCVLLLSGVQKEDIDASTLRKLQRHNVNIDDIDNRQLRKQCLGQTDIPDTLTTPKANATTDETALPNIDNESNGPQAEDTTQLQKIFQYLEFKRNKEKNKVLVSNDNTNDPELELEPLAKLLTRSSIRDRTLRINSGSQSRETPVNEIAAKTEHVDKIKTANLNKELEDLMNMLRKNINTIPATMGQESTTVKAVKDVSTSNNIKDIAYITKIVEGIISKRLLKEVNTTTSPKPNLNTNATFQKVDLMSDALSKNQSISQTRYYNNCNLKNIYSDNRYDKETHEIFHIDKRFKSGVNEPDTNVNGDDYFLCNRLKTKGGNIGPDLNANPYINNILNELKKESQRFKLLDSDSSLGITHLPQTINSNRENNTVKNSNPRKTELNVENKENIRVFDHQSTNITVNEQIQPKETNVAFKNDMEASDKESNKALDIVLQTQSKLFSQIFNQQKKLIKMCNNDKEKLKERPKSLRSTLRSHTVSNERNENIDTHNKHEDNYPTLPNDKAHQLEAKLDYDQEKIIFQAPPFHYQPSKSENDVINEEYKMWRLKVPNSLNKEDQATDTRNYGWINNRVDDKLKTTNTLNNFEHVPSLFKEYKRPWFYGKKNNKLKSKLNGDQQGILFIPNNQKKTSVTIEPKKTYGKTWLPYFVNNTAIIRLNKYEEPKNQQSVIVDSANPSALRSNDQELSREVYDSNKSYRKITKIFNENQSPDVIENRNIEQFQNKQEHINPVHFSAAKYNSNLAYFTDKPSRNKKFYTKGQNEETDNLTNKIRERQNIYRYPSKPRMAKQSLNRDNTLDLDETNIDENELRRQNETNDNIKPSVFPPNVIKDIANSIKDFVLRDLKTTIISQTTITPTTTKPPVTTTFIPVATSTTMKTTTTEETLTTSTNPFKILDASKALEKMMEMFAKINLLKDTTLKPKITQHEDIPCNKKTTVAPQKATTQRKEQQEVTLNDQNYVVPKEEARLPHYPQSSEQILEDHIPYVKQITQSNPGNIKTYVPQPLKPKPENRVSYNPQPVQQSSVNELPYNLQTLKSDPNDRVPYDPQPLQQIAGNQLPYNLQAPKHNLDIHVPYYPQTLQQRPGNQIPYDSQTSNGNPENIQQYDPQPLQQSPREQLSYNLQTSKSNPDNRIPYDRQPLQQIPRNQLPNNLEISKSKPQNRLPYDPYTLQENRLPYIAQPPQRNPEIRVSYDPQVLQRNPENRLPYDSQALQRNAENRKPNFIELLQRNQGNRTPYIPQISQFKAVNRPEPQSLQINLYNSKPYDLRNRTYVQDEVELKTENPMQYIPPALQTKPENPNSYDLERLGQSQEKRSPHSLSPSKYMSNAAELQEENSLSYVPQVAKTKKHIPYDPQHKPKNRPYDYSITDLYHHKNTEYNSYLKEIQAPIPHKKIKPKKEAITVQTNSGEISPLKIVLQKPFLQNIVITTQPSVTMHHVSYSDSEEKVNIKKTVKKPSRHQVDIRESEINSVKEDKGHRGTSRHTHKDANLAVPKHRKIKKEHENKVIQHYKPRENIQEIENFHEKLERGENREEEKITKRVQRPIVKNTNYDDTHFRNFLQTQQKVNDMLEKILSSSKSKPISIEIL